LGAPVWDCNSRLNFPSEHPLNLSMAPKECYEGADAVLALDIADFEGPTHVRDIATRTVISMVPPTAIWIDIGFTDVEISKWSMDYGRTFHAHQRMTADPVIAATQLVALLRERIGRKPDLPGKIAARTADAGRRHRGLREGWRKEAEAQWDAVPMTVPRLALEVWQAIKDEDWVLSAGTLQGWARKLWNFDRPYRHGGRDLGTGTQIGTSLGVALAHKGSGRLVVDLQPDGDLMYDAGALWIAAKYEIPLLIVMYNNRAYYNDWNHQLVMAHTRGTDPGRAHIGMDLYGPAPDFAGLARSLGWWAEGPIENADDLRPALQRAVAEVKNGKPALIDAVTQHR
jgi:acetolactate synthase I/II/III large subunit